METRVVKIGGALAADSQALVALASELSSARGWVVVHGGGAEVSQLARRFGLEPRFKDGVRQTTPQEMDCVDMALGGLVNKRIVRVLQSSGLNAVGLSGSDGRLFTGRPMEEASRTAEVLHVQPALIELLLAGGYLPVLCSTSMDEASGVGLNINADSVALAVAQALRSRVLLFLSDVPGVLKEGQVVRRLSAEAAEAEIACGTITGGMVAKIRACVGAVRGGVEAIVIGEYRGAGSLAALLDGREGTRIEGE